MCAVSHEVAIIKQPLMVESFYVQHGSEGLCFLQKSVDEGVDYCRRKVQFLKEQIDKFGHLMRDKQGILAELEGALGRTEQRVQSSS